MWFRLGASGDETSGSAEFAEFLARLSSSRLLLNDPVPLGPSNLNSLPTGAGMKRAVNVKLVVVDRRALQLPAVTC